MTPFTVSMLLPIEKKVAYYESFVLQYSMMMSTNLISYELMEEKKEGEIFQLFENWHGAQNDYREENSLVAGLMLSSESPQQQESRGLMLDKFFLTLATKNKSPKQLFSQFLNANEFFLLYAIFEGCLKSEFVSSGVLPAGKFLRENEIIDYIKVKIEKQGVFDEFLSVISQRSSIGDFKEIESSWDLFTEVRHLYAHNGGYATKKWISKFNSSKEKMEQSLVGDNPLSNIEKLNVFDSLGVEDGRMVYITDGFSNLFRNFVVNVMESLYLVENAGGQEEGLKV